MPYIYCICAGLIVIALFIGKLKSAYEVTPIFSSMFSLVGGIYLLAQSKAFGNKLDNIDFSKDELRYPLILAGSIFILQAIFELWHYFFP